MAIRFKKPGPLDRNFVGEWRRLRGFSQDDLAVEIGISKATLSRIENSINPYSQDFLEVCAEKLGCHAADLIERDPAKVSREARLLDYFRTLSESQQELELVGIEAKSRSVDDARLVAIQPPAPKPAAAPAAKPATRAPARRRLGGR